MSSSALHRTEGLTLLDDRFEQLSRKFEEEDPYMREQEAFDMKKERPDLENLLDDFLDNYELDRGGRKLVKKDHKLEAIKAAADSVSKGKLAAKRKKEKGNNSAGSALDKLGGSFGNMKI
ncbi:Protein ltv1 [Candidozyma auris]